MKKPLPYKVRCKNSKAVHYAGDIAKETLCGVKIYKGYWLLAQAEVTCPRCKKKAGG
jgi:hypothetical protein